MNKKKKFLIAILVILILVLLFFGYRFISNKIGDKNAKEFSNIISNVSKGRTDYVFIEINPSFVLTIKDNKVSDLACLNDDCISIYNDIDIKGKNINESIDSLYNISKEKGFDTSNGVKVKTKDNIDIENKDYVVVEYIDNNKEKELLNEVKNNGKIKNISNDNYYSKLLKELKNDPNYDDVYTCNMNDNNELECYIKLETGINKDSDYNTVTEKEFNKLQSKLKNISNKIFNTLRKFNFNVKDNKVYINNIEFSYVPLFTLNDVSYKNVLTAEKIDILDNGVCDYGYANYENDKCQIKDGVYIISLDKVNLVNPISIINNMITHSNGVTENALKNYELVYELEKSKKEQEERIKKCIPILEAKGVYCCNSKSDENHICGSCSSRSKEVLENNTLFCKKYGSYGEYSCSLMNQAFNEYCD